MPLPEHRALAIERSLLSRLENPTTPTLLIQSREDRCTPLARLRISTPPSGQKARPPNSSSISRGGHSLIKTDRKHDAWEHKFASFDRSRRQIDG